MSKKTRMTALVLCVCFLLAASVFASLHIESHSHSVNSHGHPVGSHAPHACTEEHCAICLQIAHFQHTLKQFCMPLLAMAFCIAILTGVAASMASGKVGYASGLVSRKVQLNT